MLHSRFPPTHTVHINKPLTKTSLPSVKLKVMNLIKYIKDKLHRHDYSKIIASQYVSFNYRNVVVECKCGKREIERWHHDHVYPFLTNLFISNKEMADLKNKQL